MLGALRFVQSEGHRWRGETTDMEIFGLAAMENLPLGSGAWFAAAANAVTAAGRTGDWPRLEALAQAMSSAPIEPAHAVAGASALSRVAVAFLMAGRREPASELLDRIEGGPAADDPVVRARAGVARSYAALRAGEPYAALVAATQAIDALDRIGDVRSATNMRVNRGHILNVLGHTDAAETALREALGAARRLGVRPVVALALQNLGSVLARRGALEEAIRLQREGLELPGVLEDVRSTAGLRQELARCCVLAGRIDEAEREGSAAVEAAAGAPTIRAQALGVLARAALAREDPATAIRHAEAAHELLQQHGSAEGNDAEILLVRAEALHAAGRSDDARHAIREARARVEAQADRLPLDMRRSFLSLAETARTLALAEQWSA
jgi:tetratricopeptide (TPR) repeat protein